MKRTATFWVLKDEPLKLMMREFYNGNLNMEMQEYSALQETVEDYNGCETSRSERTYKRSDFRKLKITLTIAEVK